MRKLDILSRALNANQALGPILPFLDDMPADERRLALESVAGAVDLHPWSLFPHAGWASLGFPSVRMDHSLAADLMLTAPPQEDELHLPWDAFLIEVPNGLVKVGNLDVAFVLVSKGTHRIQREVFFSNHTMSLVRSVKLHTSANAPPIVEGGVMDPSTVPAESEVERAFEMLDALVANVCFAGTTPGGSGPGGSLIRKTGSKPQKTRHGAPVGIQFELGAPVLLRFDERTAEEKAAMRGVVRNYIATGRREFNGCYCRRGHWHNGLAPGVARTRDENGRWHFGPDRERKFRPPTMVNRDSGVVLVRDHVLKSA